MGADSPWLDIHRSDDPAGIPVIEDLDADEETDN